LRILSLLIILAMTFAVAGDDISEVIGKKLEVKKEQTKTEQKIAERLAQITEKLQDKAQIKIIDKKQTPKAKIKSANKTAEIIIENHPIKRIKLNNITGNNTLKIDKLNYPTAKQVFAIDPTETNFTNGELEVTAKGNILYKCPTWNYTTGECEPTCEWDESEAQLSCSPKWTYQKEITPGQTYTIEITPNDPAYLETSATPDVALAALDEETFIIAFIDAVESDASYRIYRTNGTILLNTTDVDTTVDNISRIDVSILNTTHFVIAYVDGPDNDLSTQIISWNGSNATNITIVTDIDTEVGDNTDVGIAVMTNTYAICNANQDDSDADFRIFWHNGTQRVGESNIDGTMGPETTLNNLVDCTGINGSRWAYFHFDDATVNDASFAIINDNGTISTTQTDIDTDVGETGQTAVTPLAPNRFGMVFYDSTDQDITIAIRNAENTAILAPIDIDTAAGTNSRVAAGTIRINDTDTTDLLIAAWQDTSDSTIKAGIYYQNGTEYTQPFNITTEENTTYRLIDVKGKEQTTGKEICPGTFIIALSNQTGQGEFKQYHINGTEWNGICSCLGPITTSTTLIKPINAKYTKSPICIDIQADNIILDCNGYNILGNQANTAIRAQNRNNITIKNCQVNNFTTNLLLNSTTNSQFINNTLLNATIFSLHSLNSPRNNQTNSRYNNQIGNTIHLFNSANMTIANTLIQTSTFDAITNNASTKLTLTNISIDSTGGRGLVGNSSDITILNSTINTTNNTAIILSGQNGTIFNLTINTNSGIGIDLNNSGHTIRETTIISSSGEGLKIRGAAGNIIANNTIRVNTGIAINLTATTENNLTNITIETNQTWIQTDAASSNNRLNDITYKSASGSIRTITNVTIPTNTIINTAKLNTSFNLSFVNDTNLTFLNVSSQITLHGLNFTQAFPVIDRTDNGTFTLCSPPTCINQSYNGSTFIFNVTGHSSYAAIGNSPTIIHNATVVPTTIGIGNNACLILNATDSDGIENVTAIINPPIGANETLNLSDELSCNSIPGDNLWTNIYFPTIDATYLWATVNITDGKGVTTSHVINVSFDALTPFPSIPGIHPPTFAAYNSGTGFNVSLINTSDNVYATQLLPGLSNTFMYFNWTQFNFSDEQIKNAVVIVEHSYSSILGLSTALQIWNGSAFVTRCSFTPSLTETVDNCNITNFVTPSLMNPLQARLSSNTGLLGINQNVDYFVLNLTTNSPPTINHNINQTYLLNQTALLRTNITDLENDTISRVNITVTSPNGTAYFYNLTNTNGTIWEANHTDMRLKGTYNVTIRATDNQSATKIIQTSFIRRAFDIIDIIEPKEDLVPALQNFTFHNYTTVIVQNQSNMLNLSINLSGAEVKQINITRYNDSSPNSIIELSDDEEDTPKTSSFTSYEINPEGLDFTNATLLLNASGNSTLMKCANYNFTERTCFEGNWTEHLNITKGQLYTITINSTDPAFIETTAAGDVAMDPLNNTIFLIGFVDIAQTDVSFKIMNTNGSTIVGETDVDTTVTTNARVDVNWINSSHFVIFWADTSENDATFQIFSFNGTSTTSVAGPIDVDTSIGNTNVDVSIAMLDNRFITCYANNADSDADFQAYNFTGGQVVGETAIDGNIQPSAPLQNLIDCSATNNTRWTYFTFDDSVVNDATYYILNNTGGTIVGATDIDTDVGETGQVAVIGLNTNLSGLVWYDSTDQDITIAGVNNSGTTIFGPTDVDTGAGTESRVAAAAVRQNKTSTDELFAFAWWSQSNATIKAAVYRTNGTQFTAPFNVSTSINSTFPIIDITGRDIATGQELCPGTFLVSFSNNSGSGEFLGFWVNGTSWNGTCPTDLIATQLNASTLNPNEQQNVTFNGSIFNNGTVTAFNFVAAIVDGNCTAGTMIQNTTLNLSAGQNTTVNFSWSATPVGPHNISFCVNYINNILEDNYTNNNITITINVKAYNDYFGNLSGNLTLDTNTNNTEYDWRFNDSGNVMFTTANITINFSSLYALGRNTSGGIATNDFSDADQALNMTGFNDSIQILWATNASNPRQTTNFTVRGRLIQNVPYINSTNTSSFITGILWQSVNSTSLEFNATQKQPLIFVTMINRNQTGFYGRYDYEAHVPVLLRVYNSTANALQYFVELK